MPQKSPPVTIAVTFRRRCLARMGAQHGHEAERGVKEEGLREDGQGFNRDPSRIRQRMPPWFPTSERRNTVAERNFGGHAVPKTSLPRMAVTMVLGAAVATLLALMWFTLSAEAASPKATEDLH